VRQLVLQANSLEQTMKDREKILRARLREKGLKFTPERRTILAEAFRMKKHFEVAQLIERLRTKGKFISRATIYRTVALLVSCGLLKETIAGERHAHYEADWGYGHHDHLICIACGKITEFENARIEALQNEVCRASGFQPVTHQLEIRGYCKECARRRKR
jgi:Fur family ferric uptake transcriptional regulator